MKNKPRILLIEDDVLMRKYLKLVLTAKGYSYIEAENGVAGLALAAQKKPQLILLDIGLPDLDGQVVTKKIREYSAIPIIVVSGSTHEKDKVRLLNCGADDYLTKPFSTDELLARVQVALRRTQNLTSTNPTSDTIKFDGITVNLATHQVFMDNTEIHLTPTEYRLFTTLLKNNGNAVSYNQLLTEISTGVKGDAGAYLRVYIMQLRKKLERKPTEPKHFISVPGYGFRLLIS